jgi:two-component system response regulator HydG
MDTAYTQGRPILAVAAGSGQVARSAAEAGADFLLALNAGVYRNLGHGSLPSFLPFGNSNAQTLALLREHILPAAASRIPVVAGAMPGDPAYPPSALWKAYRSLGVYGVCNWPAAGFLDGALRASWERSGRGVAAEISLLRAAQTEGFAAFGFVFNPEEARAFAEAGIGILILHLGLTRQIEDVHATRDMLQLNQASLHAMLEAARAGGRRPRCLMFGGAVTEPDDLEELLRYCPLDGFAGGSVFERLPVDGILDATVRRFKGVTAQASPGATAASAAEAQRALPGMGPILGRSPAMQRLFQIVRRVAPFDVSVYIEGESGAGKELVAIQLHQHNRRASHPFVTVNCGAIPDNLLESELFGHEKGSFTGADRKRLGKFELAQHGTLFLDEVADLSPHGQVALLRALQQREIVRVGGERPIPVDVRVIAASNQPLGRLVEQGRFRADLYHRLNNVTVRVPPLRERLEDLPILAEDALSRLQALLGRRISGVTPRFLARLRRHAWPGNVRELQHVLTQAALLEDGMLLEGKDFVPAPVGPRHIPGPAAGESRPASAYGPAPAEGPQDRREAARRALAAHGGNKSRAAAALGVTRKTFYAWLDAG